LEKIEMASSNVSKAVSDPHRPKADRSRDAARKPAEVLAFAGVTSGMKIAEWIPSGGYFTRLLSGAVGPTGKVYGIDVDSWDSGEDAKMAVEPGRENVSIHLGEFGEFEPKEKVDLVWTTQNYHDLHVAEYRGGDPVAFNRKVHESLKRGGIYIVLDHAAASGSDGARVAEVHRIDKFKVIEEVTAAGFKFVGESHVLRNASDDHALNSSDPAVRGHTDQFLLKFKKA
jgi:predicted methyltransferase